jgi:hypothetical protein
MDAELLQIVKINKFVEIWIYDKMTCVRVLCFTFRSIKREAIVNSDITKRKAQQALEYTAAVELILKKKQ